MYFPLFSCHQWNYWTFWSKVSSPLSMQWNAEGKGNVPVCLWIWILDFAHHNQEYFFPSCSQRNNLDGLQLLVGKNFFFLFFFSFMLHRDMPVWIYTRLCAAAGRLPTSLSRLWQITFRQNKRWRYPFLQWLVERCDSDSTMLLPWSGLIWVGTGTGLRSQSAGLAWWWEKLPRATMLWETSRWATFPLLLYRPYESPDQQGPPTKPNFCSYAKNISH